MADDSGHEIIRADGSGNAVYHADGDASLAVVHGGGCHLAKNRNARRKLQDVLACFVAVHLRHF